MLTKITDKFFIDFESILFVDRQGKDIRVYVKLESMRCVPILLSIYTKEGSQFLKKLSHYLGEP